MNRKNISRENAPREGSRLIDIRKVNHAEGGFYLEGLYEKVKRLDEDKDISLYWAKLDEINESDLP
jgi:hypothetical protein